MSDARTAILTAVRRSLTGGEQRSNAARAAAEERIQSARVQVQPTVTGDLLERYCDKHVAVHGTFDRLTGTTGIIGALDHYLQKHGLIRQLVSGAGPILDDLDWPDGWQVEWRPAGTLDRIVISEAFAGIAETGTLVFLRTPQTPTSHLFLAEDHLVVLDISRIIRYQEEIWQRLRSEHPIFPRTVNLITGPSKTGDVEQTMEYGAHGPRRIHVFLVDT